MFESLLLVSAVYAAAPLLQGADADYNATIARAVVSMSGESDDDNGLVTAFLVLFVLLGFGVAFFVGYYVGSVTVRRPAPPPAPRVVQQSSEQPSAATFTHTVHRQMSAISAHQQTLAPPPPPTELEHSLLDSYRIKRI